MDGEEVVEAVTVESALFSSDVEEEVQAANLLINKGVATAKLVFRKNSLRLTFMMEDFKGFK